MFCDIVAGVAPAVRVFEDAEFLAILDIRPFTRGHTLVIPKRHTVDLNDTPAQTLAGMIAVGQRIAQATRVSGLSATGNNVAINDGKSAMQSVLTECFDRSGRTRSRSDTDQFALRKAISCYYSGNFSTGFRHGYVQKVVAAARWLPRPRFNPSSKDPS